MFIMDKKVDLIAKLFITYIFILALCFLLYSLVVIPTDGAEKVNAIIGLLGWSATLFAPVAAYFLLDSWKDQEKFKRTIDLYDFGIESINKSIHNLGELKNKYNVISISIEFSENQNASLASRFKSLFNQSTKEDEFKKFLIERENLVFNSFMHSFELQNKYASDYLKSVNSDEKLQKIFTINLRIYNLLFNMMNDLNNGAHMLTCNITRDHVVKELAELIES